MGRRRLSYSVNDQALNGARRICGFDHRYASREMSTSLLQVPHRSESVFVGEFLEFSLDSSFVMDLYDYRFSQSTPAPG